jgi:PAS domain S-box-containing protein
MRDDTLIIDGDVFYEAILNTIIDGVTVIDSEYRIRYQNQVADQIYGPSIGKLCYETYRGLKEPCDNCFSLDVFKDGESRVGINNVHLPNGDLLWVETRASPLRNSEGNIIAAVEVVRDVTEKIRLSDENVTLRREIARQAQFENIITQSKRMKAIFRLIERIAPTTSTVLINGESGTGKELIARAIYFNSDRKDKPFISVNCGAIPENLLESELFGHVKGAFTGAVKDNPGLIETAEGGILFLDEIGEIPLSLQVKLLRFLQDGECRRVGDTKTRKIDVRVISATNRNLEEAVQDGVFREDLYFRLSVIPIFLPPLRERREDIPLLATHLLQQLCDTHNRNINGISSEALKVLLEYTWPGNVRELENTIEYALHLTDDEQVIDMEQLPSKVKGESDEPDIPREFVSIEEYTKLSVLALQGNYTEEKIADILGISRKSLWEKRRRWGISRSGEKNT